MLYLNKSAYGEEQSASSTDSFDAWSEDSECEHCEEIRRRRRHSSFHSLSPSTASYCSIIERMEASPLLGSPAPAKVYRSVTTDSDSLGPADLSSTEMLNSYYKRLEKSYEPERKTQSSLVTIFSVWNTIMGSSLLTMAWGVERAGLPAALVLFALMAALCLYTAYVLLGVNKYHGTATCEVPALCLALLGRGAECVAHVFSLLVLLSANVVYWILITNFLYFTVNYFTDQNLRNGTDSSTLLCPKHDGVNGSLTMLAPTPVADTPYWALHSTVPLYVALIMFPLLNFRSVTFFTKFNSLGTLSVMYLLMFVLAKGWAWGVNITSLRTEVRAGRDAAVLSGMLALSFYIHNIIITIMSANERQDRNGRDLSIAFILVTLTYTLVGGVFYICFPLAKSCIEDNILNNFEMHDVMTAVARVLLLFQVITVYPLVAFMLRSEAILLLPFRDSTSLMVTINIAIVTVCILVACFCPNIGTIIRYTGAVGGLVHIFALPSILQVRSLYLRGKLTWWKLFFYAAIVSLGAINFMMQFFISE